MGLAFLKKCRLEISLRAEPPDEAANQDAHLLPRAGLQRDSLLSLKASSISAHFSVAPIPSPTQGSRQPLSIHPFSKAIRANYACPNFTPDPYKVKAFSIWMLFTHNEILSLVDLCRDHLIECNYVFKLKIYNLYVFSMCHYFGLILNHCLQVFRNNISAFSLGHPHLILHEKEYHVILSRSNLQKCILKLK